MAVVLKQFTSLEVEGDWLYDGYPYSDIQRPLDARTQMADHTLLLRHPIVVARPGTPTNAMRALVRIKLA